MLVIHVQIHIHPEYLEDFIEATIENASQSIKEPGITRFDLIQKEDDPYRFMLVEAYKTDKDPALHKKTDHYAKWKEKVSPMLAEPRSRIIYKNIFPSNDNWQ